MSIFYEIEAEDRESNLLDFICDSCGQRFNIDGEAYRGEWDHPPSVPLCLDCTEDEE